MSGIITALLILFIALVVLAIGTVVSSIIAEWRNPPIGAFIKCNGIRLHYVERGDLRNPAVVVLHGNGAMLQDMIISGLLDRLAVNSRVLCFDRPGFGYSARSRFQFWTPEAQAELFIAALKQMGVSDPVVLGHSWGTLVAIAMALRNDYSPRGLVLVSGYYFPTFRLDFWLSSGPALPILGDVFRYTLAPLLGLLLLPRILRTLFAPQPVPPQFKREFPFSLALRPKQLRAAAEESAYLIPATARLQFLYRNIKCPVQLLHGDSDQFVEPQQTRRLHRTLTRSVAQFLRPAGHMAHYADPELISRAVTALQASHLKLVSGE